jgi:hypothetical protein
LAGEEIQLTAEPSRRVAGDDTRVAVRVEDDLDGARQDDVEIVSGVALSV